MAACPPVAGGVSGMHIGAIKLGVHRSQADGRLGRRGCRPTPAARPDRLRQQNGVPDSPAYANRSCGLHIEPIYVVDWIEASDSITTTRARLKRLGSS
jgi:hypothetical protein